MKILVAASTFPQWEGDPRGRFILAHWEARARAGDQVRVLAPRTAWLRAPFASPCEVVRFAYAPLGLSSLTGRVGILENIREQPWRALLVPPFFAALGAALTREIRAFAPDLVAAHMLVPCGVVAVEAAAAAGVPCELYGHGTDVDVLLALPGPIRRAVLGRLARAAGVTLPSAEKLARTLRAGWPGPAPLRVEAMLGSVELAQAGPAEPAPPRTGRDVLFLGRLIRQKGVDDLLRAAALMPEPPRLQIAGEGPERARLQAIARDLKVDARFHGFVEGPAKEALYRASRLLCVPSREVGGLSEGAPLVIAEAKRYGLPVVATAVGGIPELMRDLYPGAPLVRPGAPQALAQALTQAIAGA